MASELGPRGTTRVHHLLHRVVGERQLELAGLDLGQVEHVVDQAEQMLAVGPAPDRARRAFVGALAVEPVEHELGEAEDRVERRAQLVAHVGQELWVV